MTAPSSTKHPRDAGGEIDISALKPGGRSSGSAHLEREQAETQALTRIDGRTLRRKSRNVTLSTKTKAETMQTIQRIAASEGMSMVDVIEKAVELFDRQLKGLK